MSDKPKVKVRLVAEWTCPECHHVNHQAGKALDEEGVAMAKDDGIDPEEMAMLPTVLFCRKCECQCEPEEMTP